MYFLQGLNSWAKGDALQGKIMVGIGLLLVLTLPFLFKSEYTLLKGMLIPLCLLTIANLGYGSFLLYSRPKHIEITTELYQRDPQKAIQKELDKMQVDNKSYTVIRQIWAVVIIVSVLAFFTLQNEYFKGLCLGLLCLSVVFLLLDTFLHYRLRPYLEFLANSIH